MFTVRGVDKGINEGVKIFHILKLHHIIMYTPCDIDVY